MTTLTYENLTVNLPDYNELTFGQYLEYTKALKGFNADSNSIEEQLKLFKVVEIFAGLNDGDLDGLYMNEVQDVCDKVGQIIMSAQQYTPSPTFEIDGVTYIGRTLETLQKLTNGEYISISMLRKQFADDEDKYIEYVISILLRPATIVNGVWKQDKFVADMDVLDMRVKLFRDKGLAKDIIPVVGFFLSTKPTSPTTSNNSLVTQ
jgi:hypothetical protein